MKKPTKQTSRAEKSKSRPAPKAKAAAKVSAKKSGNGNGHNPNSAIDSDEAHKAAFLHHFPKFKRILEREANLKADRAKVLAEAKSENVTKKELDDGAAWQKDGGAEKVIRGVTRTLSVGRYLGEQFGKQLDMFASDLSAKDQDFENGKIAALQGEMRKPPSQLSQAASQRWMEGHAAGRDLQNRLREEGFMPLGDTAKGDAVSVGDAAGAVLAKMGAGTEAVDSLATH